METTQEDRPTIAGRSFVCGGNPGLQWPFRAIFRLSPFNFWLSTSSLPYE
jgi:hypothetical protein